MSRQRLIGALVASAAIHLAILGGLLALVRPRAPGAPPLRVALVGQAGGTAAPAAPSAGASGIRLVERSPAGLRSSGERPAPSAAALPASGATPAETPAAPAGAARVRAVASSERSASSEKAVAPPTPRPSRHAARRPEPDGAGEGGSPVEAVALVTPVQSDVWVLGARPEDAGRQSAPPGADQAGAPAAQNPGGAGGAAAAPATSSAGGQGAGAGSAPGAAGTGGSSSASLLAALSQRLAWSAARCAPPALVRTSHQAVPGVPLHFCLDAAGRPSDVGLLGTTGSEQLDRAARECVVPGALPLPPVPGCYTVEVRFPIRG